MILEPSYLKGVLDRALRQVDAPADCAVALEGSIAEGFGNARSDIDLVVVDLADVRSSSAPLVLFMEGRRVEVRMRTVADIRAMASEVFACAGRGPSGLAELDEFLLDRCQRFTRSLPLRNQPALDALKADLRSAELGEVVRDWFRLRARESAHCAALMMGLGQMLPAVAWARTALAQGAKSWLAAHGETYLAKKWLGHQLNRVCGSGAIREQLLRLESAARSGLSPRDYVLAVEQILGELGVEGATSTLRHMSLARIRDVTTWQIGSRLHVIRDRKDLFVLSDKAGRVWRSLRFGRPLQEVLERAEAGCESAGAALAEFHRIGLVDVVVEDAGRIRARGLSGVPSTGVIPILSLDGANTPADPGTALIWRVPVSADRFAAAGMALAFANMEIENAKEDAMGATSARQWLVLERSIRRMLRSACAAALSTCGVQPLPKGEEMFVQVAGLLSAAPAFAAALIDFDTSLLVEDAADAQRAWQRAQELAATLRTLSPSGAFPASFDSAADWIKTLEIGYDWIRLGAYVEAAAPHEALRREALQELLGAAAQGAGSRTSAPPN